ncbi:MAG: calcium/proton exchanger [Candidatus Dormibacteraeota bacterium]|nr:calcium/proton exchanger [Candidatus Dormibacteraeota bacterium]
MSTRLLRPRLEWLLVFVPVSILAAALQQPQLTFLSACLAIVPLAGMIGRGTEELALRTGPRVGGLLNATFGNLTEIIVSALLIVNGQLEVVKASLIGSILGNILLVLGASFFAGGLGHKEQRFSARSVNVHSASLFMAVIALILPSLFVLSSNESGHERLVVSIVVAGVLIVVYVATLAFTLFTHADLFHVADAAERRQPWPAWQALLLLCVAAGLVGIESELLTRTLEPTIAAFGISPVFIGVIVIAIIGNAAEHASAVVFAIRDQVEIAVEIALGSASQVALFVAPALVFFSLAVGNPMTFIFTPLEVGAVALATLIATVLTLDGRSNWLEGLELMGVYVIVAASFFFVR